MIYLIGHVCFLFFLGTCPLQGQVFQKEDSIVSPPLSTLYNHPLSVDGKWASYSMHYAQAQDTLFVAATQKATTYSFPGGTQGKFSPDSQWFACKTNTDRVKLINLQSGKRQDLTGKTPYSFSSDGNFFLVHARDGLHLFQLHREETDFIAGATNARFHPSGKWLAYSTDREEQKSMELLHLSSGKKEVLARNRKNTYKKPVWSQKGDYLYFLKEAPTPQQHDLYAYHHTGLPPRLSVLRGDDRMFFEKGTRLTDLHLSASPDGKKVFFKSMQTPDAPEDPDAVQIWDTDDRWIYPRKKIYMSGKNGPWLHCWKVTQDTVMALGTKTNPEAVVTQDYNNALTFNKLAYEPQYTYYGDTDLYVTNLHTGSSRLILKKQSSATGNISLSPDGRYVAYFREGHWWVYDLHTNQHTNLTKELPVGFLNTGYDRAGKFPGYGSPGWTQKTNALLIYDAYDLWAVSPTGSKKRLTYGRETHTRYRIARASSSVKGETWLPGIRTMAYSLEKGLLLHTKSPTGGFGYYQWTENGALKKIVDKEQKIDQLQVSGDQFTYRIQDFDKPPKIVGVNLSTSKKRTLVQSNPHLKAKKWAKTEIISYQGLNGENLNGVLVYPPSYQTGKKYPMIVQVYEKMTHKRHLFEAPSYTSPDGFNPANFYMEDYLVLFPDIGYVLGDPGVSALHSVEAAVAEVKKKAIVDTARIGLIGHSFGGYETAFIVTQTNTFAAAVAGAPATNLLSWYLQVGWNSGRPDMWRFENQQWRMGNSYFSSPEAYHRNSPVHQTPKLKTPLLLWTGAKDMQVHWEQSIELYLAMRRLNKKGKLLIYPKERHALSQPKNQRDLSLRIKAWFDFYLKAKTEPKKDAP